MRLSATRTAAALPRSGREPRHRSLRQWPPQPASRTGLRHSNLATARGSAPQAGGQLGRASSPTTACGRRCDSPRNTPAIRRARELGFCVEQVRALLALPDDRQGDCSSIDAVPRRSVPYSSLLNKPPRKGLDRSARRLMVFAPDVDRFEAGSDCRGQSDPHGFRLQTRVRARQGRRRWHRCSTVTRDGNQECRLRPARRRCPREHARRPTGGAGICGRFQVPLRPAPARPRRVPRFSLRAVLDQF